MHVHQSFIILDDAKNNYIEHTCYCWLPMYGRKGKLDVERIGTEAHKDPLAIQRWEKP